MRPAQGKLLAVQARARLTAAGRQAFDAVLAGDAAQETMDAVPLGCRAALPVVLHAAGAAPAVLRPVLAYAWTTDHTTLLDLLGRRGVVELMRAARFPVPADVPETLTLYRGAYAMPIRDARAGISWSPDRGFAAYYGICYWPHALAGGQLVQGAPLLLRREVKRSQIVFTGINAGVEYVVDAPPGGDVDGEPAEWHATAWAWHREMERVGLLTSRS